jgi:hypothetical protein
MTIKYRFLPLVALCVVVLGSCPGEGGGSEPDFYAINTVTGIDYGLNADLLAENDTCQVWVEKVGGVTRVTKAMAEEVAREYKSKIRNSVVEVFGEKDISDIINGREYKYDDILHYANSLVGRNDKKLTILLLDIKDGFKDPEKDPYVAGYFNPYDFYSVGQNQYSNQRAMIYIDTYPALEKDPKDTYATLAHELQHLINFVTTERHRSEVVDTGNGRVKNLYLMDTWVDEGLSLYAEHLYLGENLKERCEWFNEDRARTIALGNNFFVWDNHSDVKAAILDDYATAYLFFHWMCLQESDVKKFLYNIETSENYDYEAVTSNVTNPEWEDWETLLMTWLAANNDPGNSTYGYKGDPYLQNSENISVKPIANEKLSLFPGEGVYSIVNSTYNLPTSPTSSSPNIRYAGLGSIITTSGPLTNGMLLTFNANAGSFVESNGQGYQLIDGEYEKTKLEEEGILTGVPIPDPPSASWQQARAAQNGKFIGSYRIDARDLIGRNQERKVPAVFGLFRNDDE